MKRKLFFVLFVFASVIVSAQVTWNVKAGMNISSFTSTGDAKADAKIGYKLGAGMEYSFNKVWSLQPSLLFSTKGAKLSEDGENVTVNAMYLELPIMVAARLAVSEGLNIVINAGPYLAYGVGGKMKVEGEGSIDTFGETKIELEDEEGNVETVESPGLKRFDAGLGVGFGLEFGKFLVGLDAQYGLTDIIEDFSTKNLNFSIGAAYKF
ncbi:MAG: porin family protein [Acetivibrio sp.]